MTYVINLACCLLTVFLFSSQELEGLKAVKKGWKKQNSTASSASLLSNEQSIAATANINLIPALEKRKLPKNFSEFQKIWRRMDSNATKFRYLLTFLCS